MRSAASKLSAKFLTPLLIACTTLFLCGCWEGTTRDVLSRVLAAEGASQAKNNATSEFFPLQPGLVLGAGAILQTSEDSRVDLALLPNTLVRLIRKGELSIDTLRLTKDGNETDDDMGDRRVECTLKEGRLFALHRRLGTSTAKLRLKTNMGTVRANSNCLVSIHATSDQTRVICFFGTVDFDPADSRPQITIPAGSLGDVTSKTSSILLIAADAAAQNEISDAIAAETELLALAQRERNLLPDRR